MNKSINGLAVSLMLTVLFLASFTQAAFAEKNPLPEHSEAGMSSLNSDHSQQVANHFAELVGLMNQMNQNLQRISGRVSKIEPVVLRASIPSKPSAKRGKAVFHEMQCISCHGVNGKGHEAKTNMKDERGLHIMAADLTQPSSFGNGNSRKDIFRTIMTGLDGSPMPSFVDLFVGEEYRAWDLVEYVYSLQEDTLARFLP